MAIRQPVTMLSILLLCLRLAHSLTETTSIQLNTSSNIPLNSSHHFRVANGRYVDDMFNTNNKFDHVVRIFMIYMFVDKQQQEAAAKHYGADAARAYAKTLTCTGMKILPEQIDPSNPQYDGKTTKSDQTLYNTKYVLTAGHCVDEYILEDDRVKTDDGRPVRLPMKPAHVFVVSDREHVPAPVIDKRVGYFELVWDDSLEGRVRSVKSVSRRYTKNWGDDTEQINDIDYNQDIAILELESPFTLEGPVMPLEFDQDPTGFETCRFAGWGDDDNSMNDDMLKEVKKERMWLLKNGPCGETVDRRKHSKEVHRVLKRVLSESVICTEQKPDENEETSTPCVGDSGGPLMCKQQNGEVEKIWGFEQSGKRIYHRTYTQDDHLDSVKPPCLLRLFGDAVATVGKTMSIRIPWPVDHDATCTKYGKKERQIDYMGKFSSPIIKMFLRDCIRVFESSNHKERIKNKALCGILDMKTAPPSRFVPDLNAIQARSSASEGATCVVPKLRSKKSKGVHRSDSANSATPAECDIVLRAAVLWMGIFLAWL